MVGPVAVALVVALLLLAAWTAGLAGRDRRAGDRTLYALAGAEAVLVVQVLVAAVRTIAGERPDSLGAFVGYLLVTPFLLPLGLLYSVEERTRWGTLVLTVSCLATAVVVLRLLDVWQGAGA